jgi:hypothetical protein
VLGNAKILFLTHMNLNEAIWRKGSVQDSKPVICDSPARTASQSSIQRIPRPPAVGEGESPDIIGSSRMLAGGAMEVAA